MLPHSGWSSSCDWPPLSGGVAAAHGREALHRHGHARVCSLVTWYQCTRGVHAASGRYQDQLRQLSGLPATHQDILGADQLVPLAPKALRLRDNRLISRLLRIITGLQAGYDRSPAKSTPKVPLGCCPSPLTAAWVSWYLVPGRTKFPVAPTRISLDSSRSYQLPPW